MLRKFMVGNLILCLFVSVSCATNSTSTQKATEEELSNTAVRGDIKGQAQGEVIFTKAPDGAGVKMLVNAKGLPGEGYHAAHIHQFPACAGNFTSAGSHFNPTREQHGHPSEREHHTGDLGNFKADPEGNIVEERTFTHLSLDPSSDKYIGDKAFIIHAKADDYATQPTGGAGGRIGCAVLQNTAE